MYAFMDAECHNQFEVESENMGDAQYPEEAKEWLKW
jgi:translation elongation factor P/translation initiation factor 5A